MKLVKNAAGRYVPTTVNGLKSVPYKGVGKHRPKGYKAKPKISTCIDYPANGDKTVKNLREALKKAGLKDGMTISSHHHLRNGDVLTNKLFDVAMNMTLERSYPISKKLS